MSDGSKTVLFLVVLQIILICGCGFLLKTYCIIPFDLSEDWKLIETFFFQQKLNLFQLGEFLNVAAPMKVKPREVKK